MIPPLQAERQLARIEASIAPHLDQRHYREMTAPYLREIGSEIGPRKATAADLAAMGIRRVEAVRRG